MNKIKDIYANTTKDQAASMLASCNVKIFMKIGTPEEIEETRKLFETQVEKKDKK